MLNWIVEILKNPRYAFQAALISRPAGLFVFSILIAHQWTTSEIALFESFSIFQYLIFFSWLPAWGIVSLQQTSGEDELLQKSFLFSNIFFGWLLLSCCYAGFSFFWPTLLPGIAQKSDWITIYILLSFYYFLQVHLYKNYMDGKMDIQWILSVLTFLSWIVLGMVSKDFETYLRYQVIVNALILLILKRGKIMSITIQWKFWKQVMVYSLYSITGGLGPLLAAYFIQIRFGLGNELNWFRYGTRELPVLPTWLAGFGQSHVKTNPDSFQDYEELKNGVAHQIFLVLVPLTILIIFSKPIFSFVFSVSFIRAADLMSIYLLIYIPRMIYSQVVLQILQRGSALLWIGCMELLLMIIAAVLLVPHFGYEVLVWIMVAGTGFEKLMQMLMLWINHRIPPAVYLPLKPFLLLGTCLLVAYGIKWGN